MLLVTYILHLMHFFEDKCCFEMENLVTTYNLPKDYFSEVFCIIILHLQPFQSLKFMMAIFKSSLQNLSHYIPDLKLSPMT